MGFAPQLLSLLPGHSRPAWQEFSPVVLGSPGVRAAVSSMVLLKTYASPWVRKRNVETHSCANWYSSCSWKGNPFSCIFPNTMYYHLKNNFANLIDDKCYRIGIFIFQCEFWRAELSGDPNKKKDIGPWLPEDRLRWSFQRSPPCHPPIPTLHCLSPKDLLQPRVSSRTRSSGQPLQVLLHQNPAPRCFLTLYVEFK